MTNIELTNVIINIEELQDLYYALERFYRNIINQISQFAPDIYTNYRTILSKYINLKEHELILDNQEPDIIELNVKLQWNGPNRALYDLFAQLSLTNGQNNQPLIGNTVAGLAQFLSKNVEGLPDTATVERELQKMREPNGSEKAKRGRIDLNISRDNP